MPIIYVRDNIFKPTTFNYYIISDKIVYSNMTATLGTGWQAYNNYDWIEKMTHFHGAHGFGFSVPAGGTASAAGNLVLRFADAAQDTSTGTYYDVVMTFSNASARSRSNINRDTVFIAINETEFWVQAYHLTSPTDQWDSQGIITNDPEPLAGLSVDVSISIDNAPAGMFAWPITDIDIRYDIVSGTYVIGGTMSEAATIKTNCSEILVKTNTWLVWPGMSIDITTPGSNQNIGMPIRFYNGVNSGDDSPKGDNTGVVCTFSAAGSSFNWTGSDCGTSFKGTGLDVYTIQYNANGGTNAPANQYKVEGKDLYLTSSVPSYAASLTYDANGLTFVGGSSTYTVTKNPTFQGWATSKARADAGTVDYHPGDLLTADGDLTLYAVWSFATIQTLPGFGSSTGSIVTTSGYRFDSPSWTRTRNGNDGVTTSTQVTSNLTIYAKYEYLVSVDFNGGYAIIGGEPNPGPLSAWKKAGATYSVNYTWVKSGATMLGFNTSPTATTASYPDTINYSGNAPISLYAIWQVIYYTVTFHDGYSPGGQDVLKTVSVAHGQSVPSADVPIEGHIYNGKVFKKPGLYHLSGWAGDYTNVTSTRDIIAIWEFTPIWIKVGSEATGQWIKYTPIEL